MVRTCQHRLILAGLTEMPGRPTEIILNRRNGDHQQKGFSDQAIGKLASFGN